MRSLRSKLILASILWTSGLLLLMHMLVIAALHIFPRMRGTYSPLAIFAAVCFMAVGILFVRRGLTPFGFLRQGLTAVRLGQSRNVEGAYPSEVQPLVDELNALLQDRENAVKRAFLAAGDLAHGLKTPLAVLAHEADRARLAGQPDIADSIAHQVDRMSRHMNYHLARARAAASGTSAASLCGLAPCADALVRTLKKIYASRALDISANVAPDLAVRVQREDLEEILGNLLDNACKWTTSKVVLTATQNTSNILLTIDDDGLGLSPESRTTVLSRGVRLDETTTGSGLGLTIVRDLVEPYGGSLALNASPLGGLQAHVTLPTERPTGAAYAP